MSYRSTSPDPELDSEKDPFAMSDGYQVQRGSVKDRIKFLEHNGIQNTSKGKLRRSVSLQETSSTQLRKLQNGYYSRPPSNVSSRATTPRGSLDDLRSKIPTPTQGLEKTESVESVAESTSSSKPKKTKPSKAHVIMERCDGLQRKLDALQDVCNSLSEENKRYREEQNISNDHLTTLNETCDTLQRKMDSIQTWCNNVAAENSHLKQGNAQYGDIENVVQRVDVLEARARELYETKANRDEIAAAHDGFQAFYTRKQEEYKQEHIVILNTLKQELARAEVSLEERINFLVEEVKNEKKEREKMVKQVNDSSQRKQDEAINLERQKKAEAEQRRLLEERKRVELDQKKASDALKFELQTMSKRLERMTGDFKQNVDKLENRMLEKFKDEENIVKETLDKLEIEKLGLQNQLREASVRSETLTAEQARYKEYLRNIKMSQQAMDGTSSLRRSLFRRPRSKKKENMVKLLNAIGPDGSVHDQ